MINKDKIKQIVEEYFSDSDKFLVDVNISTSNHISVFIDGDNDVTISDCSKLSRHIESFLDRDKEDYELEVSSAGTTKAFMVMRQYKKNIGRDINVIDKEDNKSKGKLIAVSEDGIKIDISDYLSKKEKKELADKTIKEFSFDDIKRVKIIFSFK